jgi:hypothetical protein
MESNGGAFMTPSVIAGVHTCVTGNTAPSEHVRLQLMWLINTLITD